MTDLIGEFRKSKARDLYESILQSAEVDAEAAKSRFKTMAELLVSSDITFYNVIKHFQYSRGLIDSYQPKSPPPGYPPGVIELGPFLYWLTTEEAPHWLTPKYRMIWYGLQFAIQELVASSEVTPELYSDMESYIAGPGITAEDGTLYGLKMYQQLDIHWLEAMLHYLYYKLIGHESKFKTGQPETIQLCGKDGAGEVRIAVIGDWGTGKYNPNETYDKQDGKVDGPALGIMNALAGSDLLPDYIIHLGDVYYAGTDDKALLGSHEESNNLLKVWSSTKTTNFTLNSNHEMYGGGHGYFHDAMGSPLFTPQQGKSFFELSYGGWTLLGLDSAYYCDDDNLYMNGKITDPTQKELLAKHQANPSKVMLFCHHNAIDVEGKTEETLWSDVTAADALGAGPGYWFWGHIHLGVAYSAAARHGDTTKLRCIGHSAVPNGVAWGLLEQDGSLKPQIDYLARTLIDPSITETARVRNGFAILTINEASSEVTEEFYELEESGAVTKVKTL